MRKPVATTATLLAALLLLVCAGRPQQAQSQGLWSQPFEVSNGGGSDWFPDITADPEGNLHVIWGSGIQRNTDWTSNETGDDLLRYRELRNGVWSAPNDIAHTCVGGATVRNSIVTGLDGKLHVLLRVCVRVHSFSAPFGDAWSARGWSESLPLGTSYYNALAVDGKGVLHALYNEAVFGVGETGGMGSEIMYRRSTDNGETWTLRQDLAQLPGGDERMQIQADDRDRLHVVWDHGSDWYTGLYDPQYGVYRRSDDGGLTWHDQRRLSVPGEAVFGIAMGLTLEGNPLVVYRSAASQAIYFQTSPDGGDTWSAPEAIPSVLARPAAESTLDRYSMATDSANRIHLLVSGFPAYAPVQPARPQLFHLVWDGQSWSQPEVVMANADYPFWPRLIATNGNQLHAVWFTYSVQGGWGHRSIWYSTRQLDTPRIAPNPPLPAPSATPPTAPSTPPAANQAATARPVAATRPVPGQRGASPPPSGELSTGWEVALALGLAPVALLLAAMLWLVTRRRGRPGP